MAVRAIERQRKSYRLNQKVHNRSHWQFVTGPKLSMRTAILLSFDTLVHDMKSLFRRFLPKAKVLIRILMGRSNGHSAPRP